MPTEVTTDQLIVLIGAKEVQLAVTKAECGKLEEMVKRLARFKAGVSAWVQSHPGEPLPDSLRAEALTDQGP